MCIDIFEWFDINAQKKAKPWLMLGKGPSFSKLASYDVSDYEVLTLNDTIKDVTHATLAHFVDIEAFERSAAYVSEKAEFVVIPWVPHAGHKPSKYTLEHYISTHEVLTSLAEQGRLLSYDLNATSSQFNAPQQVSCIYFSAEAALHILTLAQVAKIRSLGIDGGVGYSQIFSELSEVSLLANGQKSFDRQFVNFAKIISKSNVSFAPLDTQSPIKVYVASTASEALAVKVLEHSIKQHCSMSVEVTSLAKEGAMIPMPKDQLNQPRTPFSFQRFLIPKIADFKGRAIYLDSDMLVFKDIKRLWQMPIDNANILAAYIESKSGRKPQYSVMLLDCEKLDWNIETIVSALDDGSLTYDQLMYDFVLGDTNAAITPDWNSLERYIPEKTALLHYTDMHTQPWVSTLNPLGYLWVRQLREAIVEGAISYSFLLSEIEKGHVRPSLQYQIDNNIDDSILLPRKIVKLDDSFVAPYQKLKKHNASGWLNRKGLLKSIVRAKYQKTVFYRLENKLRRKIYN